MPKYQVTVTYSITVDDAKDKNHAEFCALYDIGSNLSDYNDIKIEEADTWVDTYDPSADIISIWKMLGKFDKEKWEKLTEICLSALSEMEKEN